MSCPSGSFGLAGKTVWRPQNHYQTLLFFFFIYKIHIFIFSARKRSCVSLLTRAGSKILSTPKRMRVIITKTIKVVEAEKEDNFKGVSVWQNGEQIPETDMAATTFAADGARVGIGLKYGH